MQKNLPIHVTFMPMFSLCFSIIFNYCGKNAYLKWSKRPWTLYVLHNLETTTTISAKFDFYMSKGGTNTFALVINYLDEGWTLSMLLWDYLKCMKQLVVPQLCNSMYCWKILD
jgi:hypothetical protein